jgi:hypothetical protein
MVFSFVVNTIFVEAAESEVGVSVEPQLTQEVTQPSHLGGSPALPQCLRLTDLRCFDDRPDLILIGSDSDHALEGDTQPSYRVSVIELRDEQDLPNASLTARDQVSVYTLRVSSPELLLDESHLLRLQCSNSSSDVDKKARIFANVRNRIVCQKEFPKVEPRWDIFHSSLGIYR